MEFVKWLAATTEGQVWASKAWNPVPAAPGNPTRIPYYATGDPYFDGDNVYEAIDATAPFYYFDWAIVRKNISVKTLI